MFIDKNTFTYKIMRIPYIPGKYRALSYMIYLGRKPVNKSVNKSVRKPVNKSQSIELVNKLYGTFN
tara:strand:+ start:1384 stop:1581 length:198 start_codon:yes stop_codon:yes gene_type:complete